MQSPPSPIYRALLSSVGIDPRAGAPDVILTSRRMMMFILRGIGFARGAIPALLNNAP